MRVPEVKDIEFKFALGEGDEEKGVFTGYGSIFGVMDSYGDVVEKGAFSKSIRDNNPIPLLWSHDVAEPIGIVTAKQDHNGLKVEGHLNMDVQRAQEVRSLMKQGAVKGLSIGYQTVKSGVGEVDKQQVRLLQEIKLWEISPVVFPACPGSTVSAIKGEEGLEPDEGKPFPNNHACVIDASLKVVGSMKRKHDGKEYTVRIGKKPDGGSSDHSYLYPKDTWTEAEARAHCKDHGGKFEAAKCAECIHDDNALLEEPGQPTPAEEPQDTSKPKHDLRVLDQYRLKF